MTLSLKMNQDYNVSITPPLERVADEEDDTKTEGLKFKDSSLNDELINNCASSNSEETFNNDVCIESVIHKSEANYVNHTENLDNNKSRKCFTNLSYLNNSIDKLNSKNELQIQQCVTDCREMHSQQQSLSTTGTFNADQRFPILKNVSLKPKTSALTASDTPHKHSHSNSLMCHQHTEDQAKPIIEKEAFSSDSLKLFNNLENLKSKNISSLSDSENVIITPVKTETLNYREKNNLQQADLVISENIQNVDENNKVKSLFLSNINNCHDNYVNNNKSLESNCVAKIIDDNSIEKGIDQLPTSSSETVTQVYLTRFWIIGLFSIIAFYQSIVWGTWGPILDSAKAAFPSWTDGTIALFNSWGPISVVPCMIPLSWLTQRYGLRFGILTITCLILMGTGIRCLTTHEQTFTILANIGAIINGLAGCLTLSLPAMVAAKWFPPHERTTATALGSLMCQLGGAAMYLEPLVVRAPGEGVAIEDIQNDIRNLMYIQTGIAAVLFLCAIIYFPSQPKCPPSKSSAVERLDYFTSVKSMLKNTQLLLVIITYVFSFGIPVVWIGVMNFSLGCVMDIKQDESMWIAVVSVTASGIAAFVVARITDHIYGYLKVTIIGLLVVASGFFLWFLLLTFEVITPTIGQVYASVTGGIAFEFATVPLLLELAVELAYPCPEGAVGAMLTQLFNIISGIFLLLFLIPTQCYHWVNIVLVVCTSLTIIPLFFVKEKHRRSANDR